MEGYENHPISRGLISYSIVSLYYINGIFTRFQMHHYKHLEPSICLLICCYSRSIGSDFPVALSLKHRRNKQQKIMQGLKTLTSIRYEQRLVKLNFNKAEYYVKYENITSMISIDLNYYQALHNQMKKASLTIMTKSLSLNH